jgi:menaquinone-specific isochorismate synthase
MTEGSYAEQIVAAAESLAIADRWQFQRIDLGKVGTSPIGFLAATDADDSMLFSQKGDCDTIAGVGTAARWDGIPPVLPGKDTGLRCFACLPFRFQKPESAKWKALPTGFFIPEFECHSDGSFFCNLAIPPDTPAKVVMDQVLGTLDHLFQDHEELLEIPGITRRDDRPSLDQWEASVKTVLELIEKGDLQKLVLAREATFHFGQVPNVLSVLTKLMELNADATIFMFRSGPTCFLGATPELLFTRDRKRISSHAIAATRSRGRTDKEDNELAQALLSNSKELHEHALVTDMITSVLRPFCAELETSDISVLKLPHVQHLYRAIEGKLTDTVTDAEVLASLHPTPAVGGTPRDVALTKLEELETFERGCYASPIGYLTEDDAAFYVAIRSALFSGDTLSVYAGAGIVDGSDAQAEWQETEKKMGTFTTICHE